MTLLKRLFGDLFSNSSTSLGQDEKLVREKIEYTEFFLTEYEQWKVAGLFKDILEFVRAQKSLGMSDPIADTKYFQHRSDSANGFYFLSDDAFSNKDYSFITYYFSELLKENGYVLNNSRRDVQQKAEKLICTEEFYFKLPLSSRAQSPIPQLWGNIIIQHHQIDDRTSYVKIMAHHYSDRSYEEAKDYEGLEELLLNS